MTPSAIRVDDVSDLIAHIDDPHRMNPVVIVSPARREPRYGLPPNRLAADLGDRASVWMLNTAAVAWALGSARPEVRTYGGAIRIVGTGTAGTVLRTDLDDRSVVEERILAAVARYTPTVRPVEVDERAEGPSISEHPQDSETRQIGSLRDMVATRDRHLDMKDAEIRGLGQQLTARERDLAVREAEISQLGHQLTARERRIGELQQALEAVQRELADAADAIELRDRIAAPVYHDPQQQLRHEIQTTWLYRLPEVDRIANPLRGYEFGPEFIASLATPLASRQRCLDVIVDVLTRQAFMMASRSVHPHGDGHVTAPAITGSDGATAYRCYVKSRSPGAARLLWWELVDGSVELAYIGHHDDNMPLSRRVSG